MPPAAGERMLASEKASSGTTPALEAPAQHGDSEDIRVTVQYLDLCPLACEAIPRWSGSVGKGCPTAVLAGLLSEVGRICSAGVVCSGLTIGLMAMLI